MLYTDRGRYFEAAREAGADVAGWRVDRDNEQRLFARAGKAEPVSDPQSIPGELGALAPASR